MRSKHTHLSIGTISHGTMRPEDLIPEFLDALDGIRLSKRDRNHVRAIRARSEKPGYYETDEAHWDLDEDLWELLSAYAPPLCYAGSTEGDGSDYGIWPILDDEDTLKVNQPPMPGQFPADIRTCYEVNDHGNVTLWVKKIWTHRGFERSKWVAVWYVV